MGWGSVPEQGWRKGPWTPEEDKLLTEYVSSHGDGRWSSVARSSGNYYYYVGLIHIFSFGNFVLYMIID